MKKAVKNFVKKPTKSNPDPDNDGDNDYSGPDTDEDSPIKAVRNMVAAHGKVAPAKRANYRKAVIAKARKCGAMQHVPSSWIGKGG